MLDQDFVGEFRSYREMGIRTFEDWQERYNDLHTQMRDREVAFQEAEQNAKALRAERDAAREEVREFEAEFACPLSLDVPVSPRVNIIDGRTYDRSLTINLFTIGVRN